MKGTGAGPVCLPAASECGITFLEEGTGGEQRRGFAK